MMLLTNPHGAGMEPVQHTPPSPDMRGEWGHLGSFEFAIGVRNIEQAAAALSGAGIELALRAADGRPRRWRQLELRVLR